MIVVATYGPDQYGRAAVDAAADLVSARGGRLIVANLTLGDRLIDPHWASEEQLTKIRADLEPAGVSVEFRHEIVRDLPDGILSIARVEKADLLVVGIRRRTAVGKLLLGSLAQRLILDAECPVLAVKPPKS